MNVDSRVSSFFLARHRYALRGEASTLDPCFFLIGFPFREIGHDQQGLDGEKNKPSDESNLNPIAHSNPLISYEISHYFCCIGKDIFVFCCLHALFSLSRVTVRL